MSRMVIDGLRWEVRARGTGRPLLLLHGFTGRGTSWGAHAAALARNSRVITVDLPGHGRSSTADSGRMTVERTADDVATLLGVGADKVGVNSAAIARPVLIDEIAANGDGVGTQHSAA